MKKNKALINYLLNHFPLHPARIMIMMEMIFACIKTGSMQQQRIAQGVNIKAKTSSITRRIQRFFAEEFLDPKQASKLIFSVFDWEEKINFILDRTNWKFGIFDINLLVLCAVYKNYSIPIYWILLPHGGNSGIANRIHVIDAMLLIIPKDRIRFLLADREFIGSEWFCYLQSLGIPFCIRIKENMLVKDIRRGGTIALQKLFRHLLLGESRELHQIVSGTLVRIFGTRISSGELLILAVSGDDNLFNPFELYSKRWFIETMFKSFKSSGFNLEDTHQKHPDRLYKMIILLTIAYAWAIKIGEIKHTLQPIKIKLHNRFEFSLFSYGFRVIQTIFFKSLRLQNKLLRLITKITLNIPLSPHDLQITVVY